MLAALLLFAKNRLRLEYASLHSLGGFPYGHRNDPSFSSQLFSGKDMGIMLSRKTIQYLQYVYRGGGATAVLVRVVRRLLAPLYQYEARYILVRRVPERNELGSAGGAEEDQPGECVILESPGSLQTVEREISASITHSLASLKRYLERGAIVFLAFTPPRAGVKRAFVGYSISQLGVISIFGRERRISPSIICATYTEFLPQYRGQRNTVIRLARDEYCRKNGLRMVCTTVSPDNHSSMRGNMRAGYQIVGRMKWVSLLRRRYVWETPWAEIEEPLRKVELSEMWESERRSGGAT